MLKQSVQKSNASGTSVIAISTTETDKKNIRILSNKSDEDKFNFGKKIADKLTIVDDKIATMDKSEETYMKSQQEKTRALKESIRQAINPFVLPKETQLSQTNPMPIKLPSRISSNLTILSCPVSSKVRYEEPSPYVTIEKKPAPVGQILVNSTESKQTVVLHPKLISTLQKIESGKMENKSKHTKPSSQSLLKTNQTIKINTNPSNDKSKHNVLLKNSLEDRKQLSPRNQRSKSLNSNNLNKFPRKLSSNSDCGLIAIETAQNKRTDFQPIQFNASSQTANNTDEDSPLVVDAADFEKITEGKVIESYGIETTKPSNLLCDESLEEDIPIDKIECIKSGKSKTKQINRNISAAPISPSQSTFKANVKNELSMLTWSNGVAKMNHSNLAFEMNEFSLLEVHENHIFRDRIWIAYEQPLSKRKNLTNKITSPNPLYLCLSCSCHGAAVDFLAPFFCSLECANRVIQKKRQERCLTKLLDSMENSKSLKESTVPAIMKPAVPAITKTSVPAITKPTVPAITKLTVPAITKPTVPAIMKRRSRRKTVHNESSPSDKSVYNTFENNDTSASHKTFQWVSYLKDQNAKMAIVDYFLNPFPSDSNHFEVGMKLEAIDPENNSLFCVCSIVEKRGYRLKLHFDGYKRKYDFWVNADSMDVFPPGWCSKTERILQPPREMNMLSFNWPAYLNRCHAIPAPRQLFTHLKSSSSSNPFKIQMKLEAEDLKNTRKVCVATVNDVLDSRILIHFDGWSERYDYWVDISSPYIYPVGWHSTQGLKIVAPPDWNSSIFTWSNYLEFTKTIAADEKFFRTREPIKFDCGMKLEVVDKKNPTLIRPATILIVDDYELKIVFDGWPETFAFWTPDDSPDIHPVGWCELTGHDLEPPPGYKSVLPLAMPCPIRGCRGIGNAKKSEIDFHATAESCPYELNNWMHESEKPSRLNDNEKSSSGLEDLPVCGNKKRNSSQFQETEVVEPIIKQIKRESLSASPEPSENTNLDIPIVVAKRFLCDYGPRLKQNYDIWYKNSKWLRKTIAGITDKNPLKWTVDETAVYIEALPSCASIAEIFRHNEIDGEALLSMRQSDLTSHLKLKVGPAMKIFSLITNLRGDVIQFHKT